LSLTIISFVALLSAQFNFSMISERVQMIYTRPWSSIQPFLAKRSILARRMPYRILASAETYLY